MQTNLADFIRDTPAGREANDILRSCVHCGFCTATCPTYQLLGDELDGPRGRIYLIKQALEGQAVTERTRLHLDRCLTCRACETTCPSGVRYGRLAEIGREVVEHKVPRPWPQRFVRGALLSVLPYRDRFTPLLRLGQMTRPLLPGPMRRKLPAYRRADTSPPAGPCERRVLGLAGCVQPALAPDIDAATTRVLARAGVEFVKSKATGCCGAVSHHLSAHRDGLQFMRRNIDAWWPEIEAGAEAIVVTASACALMVKEYASLFAHDPEYRDKAARVAGMTRDLGEYVAELPLAEVVENRAGARRRKVAFHSPCTLQHGQRINGVVESLLRRAGFELTPVPNAHLCCGSAGTYSVLQPGLSQRLLENKLTALESGQPDVIATANIGCLTHLQSRAAVAVTHWIGLLDEALSS